MEQLLLKFSEGGLTTSNGSRACASLNDKGPRWYFTEWLRLFQGYAAKKPGRKFFLLINCSAHGREETLPSTPKFNVLYFPPNCLCKIQKIDDGVISALKVRHKRMYMERALENIDTDVKNIYKVYVPTAMRWFSRV